MISLAKKKWFRFLWVVIFGASCFTLGYSLKPKAGSGSRSNRMEMLKKMQGQSMRMPSQGMRMPTRVAPARRMGNR